MRSHRFIPKAPLVDKETMIVCLAEGKSCLHIGMGGLVDDQVESQRYVAAGLADSLQGRLSRVTRELVGIDINPYMLQQMEAAVPGEYFHCDVTRETEIAQLAGRQFELIIFGDVIEHLDNPGIALKNLLGLLKENGRILISTVNAYSLDAILKMVVRYEAVHEEHTAYFSYSTLKRLLAMNGMEIFDFMYYTHKKIGQFDGMKHRLGWYFEQPFIRAFPQYAMGLMAVTGASPRRIKADPVMATRVERELTSAERA